MSFSVALQSAIFYICACTPCAQAREHRNSKRQAKKDREEKIRMEMEMPHLYRHPDPFNTNPYWSEEIQMGPSLPRKKTGNKSTSQRALNGTGRESRSGSTTASSIAMSSSNIGSSPTVVPEDGDLTLSTTLSVSEDWNKKRYQREDEELWGRDISLAGQKLMDAIKQAGTSAGRIIEATLGKEPKPVTEDDRYNFYASVTNPPVNDYHPPVVSQRPKYRDAAKWMLQPPPPAKVMEGKVPVSRSTSMASQASRRTATDGPALGRRVHEKMISAKLRMGEMPTEPELAATLPRPANRRKNTSSSRGGLSQRTARSRSLSLESSDASDELKKRRRPRARPPINPDYDSSEDENYMARVAQRPKLPTIMSSQAPSVREGQGLDQGKPPKSQEISSQPSSLHDISNITSQPDNSLTEPSKVASHEELPPTVTISA
jgi:hypothetical protein